MFERHHKTKLQQEQKTQDKARRQAYEIEQAKKRKHEQA